MTPRARSEPGGTGACLYCGGDDLVPFVSGVRDRAAVVPGEFAFDRCTQCDSAMLSPVPRAEDLPGYYPEVYSFAPELATGWRRRLAEFEYQAFYRPSYRAEARMIDRYCRRSNPARGKVLDIGCGRALRLLEFRRLGYDVHGCDFQPLSVDYLNSKLGIPAKQGDVSRVDDLYAPESFDVVTAFHVIEHLLDVGRLLRGCHSILKPGGVMVVCIPMADSIQARVLGRKWAGFTEAPRHIALPSRKALTGLCAGAGFEAGSIEFCADDVLSCAAEAALSLVPASATGPTYGSARFAATLHRALGAAALAACVPWAFIDNHVFRRPAHGIVMARKRGTT